MPSRIYSECAMGLTARQKACKNEAQILAKELVLLGYDIRIPETKENALDKILLEARAGGKIVGLCTMYCSRWWYLCDIKPRRWLELAHSCSWDQIVIELKAWLRINGTNS